MARFTRHPIRDESVLVASRQACLLSSDVVPAGFWTAPPSHDFDGFTPMSREASHAAYGHAHVHGTLDGQPAIVQEWLGCEVLPFGAAAWLFHARTPESALVVLRGDVSVTVGRLRAHVRGTPEWAAWHSQPGACPYVGFPDTAALTCARGCCQ